MKTILIAIYGHPEAYPPTLNAVECLSLHFEKVVVVCRNIMPTEWEYPSNVTIIAAGEFVSVRESEQKSYLWKLKSFRQFSNTLAGAIKAYQPDWVQCCDPLSIFSFQSVKSRNGRKTRLWYHNHDVLEVEHIRKFTLSWFAARSEHSVFRKLDLFTLPADERKACFPLDTFRGKYFLIPNYPSRKVYGPFYQLKDMATAPAIRLVFQGSIGPYHGLENIIPLLAGKIEGKELFLVLKGFIRPSYKEELETLARQHGVLKKVVFYGVTSYREVPRIASECHVGVAIHMGEDIMNKTLGTSSNKIYEYAAVGLPVLLYNNEHFKKHLGNFEWAFFTDCSDGSLKEAIANIVLHYPRLSQRAHGDFMDRLNFESRFQPVISFLENHGE